MRAEHSNELKAYSQWDVVIFIDRKEIFIYRFLMMFTYISVKLYLYPVNYTNEVTILNRY